jgi:phage portal protein
MNLNMQDDDIKKAQDRFVNDYMNVNNNGGVAALDSRMEYQELKGNIVTAESDQMKLIRQDIMGYFHLNESILLAKYDENEWSAFYESVLEPIAIRLGLELTRKSFTQKELGFGNQIIFEANRLQYTSNTSKITLLKELLPMGLLTINEGREILNLAPVEGGEKRIISLNYVDADKANEYQLGRISKKADESKKEPEEDSNAEGGDAK